LNAQQKRRRGTSASPPKVEQQLALLLGYMYNLPFCREAFLQHTVWTRVNPPANSDTRALFPPSTDRLQPIPLRPKHDLGMAAVVRCYQMG
jgi:hypothetical protein